MAGATAFFTTFALPPILIILIEVMGLLFGQKMISASLFQGLAAIIHKESVTQIVETLQGMYSLAQNWFISVGGFIFLLFVATTLFMVIQRSLNQLWRIKAVKDRKIWAVIRSRIQSLLVILVAGILFVPNLVGKSSHTLLANYLNLSAGLSFYVDNSLTFIISTGIVTLWFVFVFRYLPDARPGWGVAFTGALLTSLLFNAGKLVLRWSFNNGKFHGVYGSSGSIILLLLFVFYSSLILYYGAAFTKIWGEYHQRPILPLPHAVQYKVAEEGS